MTSVARRWLSYRRFVAPNSRMTHAKGRTAQRRAYDKGRLRRQQILDRAVDVFADRGADRTSLRSIADAVGVTHPALRHYFGSLEELLVEAYRKHERAQELPSQTASAETPVGIMRRSAERNRQIPGLVQLYTHLVASALDERHHVAREFAGTRFAHLRGQLVEHIERDQRQGRIRNDVDPRAVAALVIAASDGLQTQLLLDPTAPQDDALDLLQKLLATGQDGLAAAPRP